MNKKIKRNLIEGGLATSLISVSLIGMLNIMALEPYVMSGDPNKHISDFTAKEYTGASSIGKVMGYICYPGAKLGRKIHNNMVK